MVRKSEELERTEAEATSEITQIRESGGTVLFIAEYVKYYKELSTTEGQSSTATAGRKFRKRPVQLAAVAAWQEADEMGFDSENSKLLGTAARFAYERAAGHYSDDEFSSLPEEGAEAAARRAKAARDWDQLINSDPDRLIYIALFGDEMSGAASKSRLELIKGIASIFFLVALAVVGYYIWSSR